MPKFSFPIPGRKHTSSKDKEKHKEKAAKPVKSPSVASSSSLSKAQRFFGADNDINIDSHTRDDDSWRLPSSTSSAMSISISESTHSTRSTAETGSIHTSQSDRWDMESGVFPRAPRLNGKASSTLLGKGYGDDGGSMSSTRLRNEDSSSTLKSYYDRHTSPLAISQQTSESSARDLALRKGLPPIITRSPLLQVESVDVFDTTFSVKGSDTPAPPKDKGSKKKPNKLDFSMLFPRARNQSVGKAPDATTLSMLTNESPANQNTNRRKLTKPQSRESLRSQNNTNTSTQSDDAKHRQASGTLYQLYDHYEQLPARSPRMHQIPESRVPAFPENRSGLDSSLRNFQHKQKPGGSERKREQVPASFPEDLFAWNDPQSSMKSPPWETSSATSISSHNTKTSRRTSASAFSSSDLKEKSVLSLSSGSEGEDSGTEPLRTPATPSSDKASRVLNSPTYGSEKRRHSKQQSGGSTPRSYGPRKGAAQSSSFLSIPEASIPNTQRSGPWSPPKIEEPFRPSDQQKSSRRSSTKAKEVSQSPIERRDSKRTSAVPMETRNSITDSRDLRYSDQKEQRISSKQSISSKRSSQQPTPPLSPTSVEFWADPEQSNRFMAVTKQEEALLEALRQKRAKMREEIIEEHEISNKSPPRTAEEIKASRISEASSVSTIRGPNGSNKQTVLLYLNTPISEARRIDTAEPSPDLSDFLSFGSDEDSTPRTLWAPPIPGAPGPNSAISADPRVDKPITPPSAARLSAVGAANGFKEGRANDRRKPAAGVRFVDDTKVIPPDFLIEEDETDVIWGM